MWERSSVPLSNYLRVRFLKQWFGTLVFVLIHSLNILYLVRDLRECYQKTFVW